jgi:hypothetical protein
MTLVEDATVSFDTSLDTVMNDIRKPVLVDNAIHYSNLNIQTSDKNKVIIENRKAATYHVASQNTYQIKETSSAVELTHSQRAGHTYEGTPYYEGGNIKSGDSNLMLFYNSLETSQRLKPSSFDSKSKGVNVNLKNMQEKTISDLGFTGDTVHLAQPIDVGFRTTDLAIQLTKNITDTVTSINIGSNRNISNSNFNRRFHSHKFLAQDFKKINILSALKFIARHDYRVIMFDRFSNLLYVPFNFSDSSRLLLSRDRTGTETRNPVDDTINSVSVRGIPLALNDPTEVTVNDFSRQQGAFNSNIQSKLTPLFDITVKTEKEASIIARQILKANSTGQGSLSSNGHINAWDLRPGNIISYDGKKYVVMETTHVSGTNLSDFEFLTLSMGVDGLLQGITDGLIAEDTKMSPDISNQIKIENMGLFNELNISVTAVVSVRPVSSSGFIIGKNAGRSTIGKGKEAIGLAKGFNNLFVEEI